MAKKRESPEAFYRRARQENVKQALAEGRLEEAEAYIKGYLAKGLLSQSDVASLQAELAPRRSHA